MQAAAIVFLLVVFAFLLPARFDPAIRLKEWVEAKRAE